MRSLQKTPFVSLILGLVATFPAVADEPNSEELSPEEIAARKAADPLGDVKALMTDNTIAFGGGESEDDITYGFQLQPVYAMPTDKLNMILRAVVPIIGVEPGVVVPPIGGEPRPADDSMWGLSDTIVQYFFSPKSEGSTKWGIGPQVSLETHTSDRTAGPGWGGGLAGVIFGGGGPWSIGYNNSISYNWNVEDSSNALTAPLGLTFGKALVLGSGDYLDLSIGAYPLVARPERAPQWQLKLGLSYFFN